MESFRMAEEMKDRTEDTGVQAASFIGIERLRYLTDGPGITTLVGFQGCPLNCVYCLNPQCHDNHDNIQYTPLSLIDVLKRDDMYFAATGGGVTFGGGEPLLYPSFITEFRKQAHAHWTINVETSLNVSQQNLYQLVPIIDYYIVDIKDTNPIIYKRYTDNDNTKVLENLEFLLYNGMGNKIEVRIPEIPNYNSESDIYSSIVLLKQMGIEHISFLTYKVKNAPSVPNRIKNNADNMYGKSLCKILKNIRVEKAKELGIDYEPTLCTNTNACSGTCPICEKELEFINSSYI